MRLSFAAKRVRVAPGIRLERKYEDNGIGQMVGAVPNPARFRRHCVVYRMVDAGLCYRRYRTPDPCGCLVLADGGDLSLTSIPHAVDRWHSPWLVLGRRDLLGQKWGSDEMC